MKLTKRKGFNFFRSYFDVYNELESKDDKVAFMDALLERQFMGVKPTELKGMAKFAYISQTNSIDSQVKGYEDKTKTRLNPLDTKIITPTEPPTYGGKVTPTLQVQVEVQEKGKEEVKYNKTSEQLFFEDWNDLRLKHLKKKSSLRMFDVDSRDIFLELYKHHTREEIQNALIGLFKQKKLPNDNEVMQSNPKHFLKYFNTYLSAFEDKNTNLYGKTETI